MYLKSKYLMENKSKALLLKKIKIYFDKMIRYAISKANISYLELKIRKYSYKFRTRSFFKHMCCELIAKSENEIKKRRNILMFKFKMYRK